jgi:hypothetical protein
MVNKHIPTSLRLIPRASNWADSVNTCTEVFSNCRFRRRRSCLKRRLKIICPPVKAKVAKRSLQAKLTNVQWNVERLFNRYLGLSQSGDYTH